jgi:uncharacterized membrane protein YczE
MGPPVELRGGVAVRSLSLVLGLFTCAFGTTAALRAGFGLQPWAVLAQGLARHVPLSFGSTTIAISLVVLALAWRAGAQLGIGTCADAVLVGLFIDVLTRTGWAAGALTLGERLGLLALGLASLSLGIAVYLGAAYGGGPRDSLMLVVWRRTGYPIGSCRLALELVVLVLGFALGGTVGVGTVVLACLTGPGVQLSFGFLALAGLACDTAGGSPPATARLQASFPR